jgi:two-component system cell cycle sensor histidine kinase/response regulator CckA
MPKILVIDDRQDNLVAIEALLNDLIPECQVVTAQSGVEGIERAYQEYPDTILLDIQMPGMDGYEVCRKLKTDEKCKNIPIIFITAIETDTQSRIKGLALGGDAFLVKPIDEKELAAQVNVMLRIRKARGELEAEKENLEEREQEKTRALAESEEKLHLLFNETHDLITLCDAGAQILWANPAWRKIFNAELGRQEDLFSFLHPEDLLKVSQAWMGMKAGNSRIKNLEYRLRGPGGEYRTFESSVHPAKVTGQELFYIIAHDISERKQAEEALKESEERYRTITENSPDIITRYDKQLCHVYVSPNIVTVTGKSAEEYLGKTFKEVGYADEVRIPMEEAIIKIFRTGEPQELEYEYHSSSPQFPVPIFISQRLKPEFAANGSVETVIGVSHDITERKKLEEQLRQAQKMEAIGTLAGGIAHDFNNILGVIMGYTELTLEETPEGGPHFQNLKQVMAAAQRAEEMVRQILAFSRKSEKERKPTNINHILQEALKMLRSSLPTTIDIQTRVQENLGLVMANPTQIHQIIVNLATNAAHAMREKGGQLEIRLEQLDLPEDNDILKGLNLTPGSYQELTVTDTGHGMTAEVMERIFEPYFTTKRPGEGTGMGLSVAHGIIKSHGGEITVSSEPFKGTTFQVYLPVVEDVEEPAAAKGAPVTGGTEHILFVDDESSLAEMGKMMLEKLGYRVTARTSSVEALEAFRKTPDKFDLVISDQTMPNMAGTQLTRELLRTRPDIPVILSTGFSEIVNKENFKSLGIRAFVMKPIIKNEIARIIRDVLEENRR